MDRSFKICIKFKFSDLVVRSLSSAGSPYSANYRCNEASSSKIPVEELVQKMLHETNLFVSKLKFLSTLGVWSRFEKMFFYHGRKVFSTACFQEYLLYYMYTVSAHINGIKFNISEQTNKTDAYKP